MPLVLQLAPDPSDGFWSRIGAATLQRLDPLVKGSLPSCGIPV
jgi:hypothetical protein